MNKREQQRLARERAARQHRHRIWTAVAVTAVVAVAGAVTWAIQQATQSEAPAKNPVSVSVDHDGLVLGSGPVTVELYSDFLCPACRAFEADARDEIDQLLADNRIRLVYRPVAILENASTNHYSSRAGSGAACAADAGKLIDYVHVLFDNQPAEGGAGHDNAELIRLAGTVGLTDPGFVQCVRDERYVGWVEQVTDTMATNNVLGTPTVLVAGKQLQTPSGARLVAAVADTAG